MPETCILERGEKKKREGERERKRERHTEIQRETETNFPQGVSVFVSCALGELRKYRTMPEASILAYSF